VKSKKPSGCSPSLASSPETRRLVEVPIRVSIPPRIAAKLSGIITAEAERPKRSAIERRIGMKITTIGVLLRNPLLTVT
jgi:hypothetical protein